MKRIIIIALATALSACGFHLRGQMQFSPFIQSIYLQTSSQYTPLSQAIEQTLAENHLQLQSSAQQAKLILKVFNEQQSNILLTVGASQQNRQYKLMYSIQFALYNKQGKLIIGPKTINEIRTQIIQANQLLDNNTETTELYNSMRTQAVTDLLYQLTAKDTNLAIQQAMQTHENKNRSA